MTTLDPDLTRQKPEYMAFVEARKSESIAAIRLEESTGTLHLIQYMQIGRITYAPAINLLTIPSGDTVVCIVGKNIGSVIDAIQQKKLKTISVLRENDKQPEAGKPVVLHMSFHSPEDDEHIREEVVELLHQKGLNLTDL